LDISVEGARGHARIITGRDVKINRNPVFFSDSLPARGSVTICELSPAMDKQTFGARIANLRVAAGLTQESLAARLGFQGTSRLGNYERGAHYPQVDMLEKLAAELGVTVADLFLDDETAAAPSRVSRDVMPATLPGHVVLDRLKGFDKAGGQDRIALPEVLLRQRSYRGGYESVRWVINPTSAMSPRIAQGAMVLVDTDHNALDQVLDGETYSIRLWDRPDIRKIYLKTETSIWLVGEKESDRRIELTTTDFPRLVIGGLVIDVI
jgi:DNA-binding XRE family transcriptional regulator